VRSIDGTNCQRKGAEAQRISYHESTSISLRLRDFALAVTVEHETLPGTLSSFRLVRERRISQTRAALSAPPCRRRRGRGPGHVVARHPRAGAGEAERTRRVEASLLSVPAEAPGRPDNRDGAPVLLLGMEGVGPMLVLQARPGGLGRSRWRWSSRSGPKSWGSGRDGHGPVVTRSESARKSLSAGSGCDLPLPTCPGSV
jgi:hypothetical protein